MNIDNKNSVIKNNYNNQTHWTVTSDMTETEKQNQWKNIPPNSFMFGIHITEHVICQTVCFAHIRKAKAITAGKGGRGTQHLL